MTDECKDSISLSDDEDEYDNHLPELSGTLNKWTNYIHGWQDRYIVLRNGTLSYYKSEDDTSFGCRGAISLSKAAISEHDFDDCRIDVCVNDSLWYLRTRSPVERQTWYELLELHRSQTESGYGSESSLNRHGSLMSLTSTASQGTTSTSSFKRGGGLKEKVAEIETFRGILCQQVDTLQGYFDACSSAIANKDSIHDHVDTDSSGDENLDKSVLVNNAKFPEADKEDMDSILRQHGAHAVDFKGESFTFRATTAGILLTMGHCVEVMAQREDQWRLRYQKEVDRRKRYSEAYRLLLAERPKQVIIGGPDYEEGPHSVIHEEEFFDAVDATLDKLEHEENVKKSLPAKLNKSLVKPATVVPSVVDCKASRETKILFKEMDDHVSEHLLHCNDNITSEWQLIAEDGEMKVYKMELEVDGITVDPIKAVHTVKGVTGHELCHYFWDQSIRMQWESTLDVSDLIQTLSDNSVITHQVHKRVWPASTRDSLFWSTIRHVTSGDQSGDEQPDCWIVVNKDTNHPDMPLLNKYVRMKFNVAMICHTIVKPPDNGDAISRENLSCKIQYSANVNTRLYRRPLIHCRQPNPGNAFTVNPGGWAPASVIRMISKRELPKFLHTFTSFVQDKTEGKPIMF